MISIPSTDNYSLKIIGSSGEFRLGKNSRSSVHFIETHISPGRDDNSLLTSMMKPVREIFDISKLDFANLVQRDLDDARVANYLIPYLLKETGISFRFFPPILAVALPVKNGKPQESYSRKDVFTTDNETGCTFEDQLKIGFYNQNKSLGFLHTNPTNIEFAIIDGQHRAMAILALFRNTIGRWEGS